MKDKIVKWFQYMTWMGYTPEQIESVRMPLYRSNTRTMNMCCIPAIVSLIAISVVKYIIMDVQLWKLPPVIICCIFMLFAYIITKRVAKGKMKSGPYLRVISISFIVLLTGMAVLYDLFIEPTNSDFLIAMVYIVGPSIFDELPLKKLRVGLIMWVGISFAIVHVEGPVRCWNHVVMTSFAAVVGLFLSWIKTQSKFELLLKQDMERRLFEQEKQVNIMMSQMRPHFIYNVLSTISVLIDIDAKRAQEAITDFSDYLRVNMDAVKEDAIIPFEKELEHIKHYARLEQLRFGKKLQVEYDIEETDFFLPVLSLQPVVENAIKHGVGNKAGGGTVTLRTVADNNRVRIIISDDGVGFDILQLANINEKNGERSHIGIANVCERIEAISGASYDITSQIGQGTTVTIVLPK